MASGPSAGKARLETLRGRARVIAVNESWRLYPWADVLYGCDGAWWKLNAGVPQFTGLKLSQDTSAAANFADVHKVDLVRKCDQILVEQAGQIGSGSKNGGGNSGFQALNIAVQFGAARIILIGFDLRLDLGIHWHGHHPKGLNNPGEPMMIHWRRAFNEAATTLAELGIEVLNASPVSTLTAYPIVKLEDVF